MQRFDLNQIAPSPWKNGGGSTREIVCWPQGAGMDSFGWRVSVATIAQAGPFSAFAGIDRQIMLLDGDGVRLHSAQAGLEHALTERWQPFAFSGDMALDCDLLGGPSSDFNVMTRRGQWSARLEQLGGQAEAGLSAAGLCMVLQGSWKCADGRILQAGQGLWWSSVRPEPLVAQAEQARVIMVSLTPHS